MYKPKLYNPNLNKPLKPRKKKDLRYWQTDLSPLGDYDKDGKINLLDCYPYDKNRQGFWHDIKQKVKGEEISDIQQLQKDIENFKYDEESGKYVLPKKKKKKGEKGYIKEGAEEVLQDIKHLGSQIGTGIKEKATGIYESIEPVKEPFKDAGIHKAREHIKEGLEIKPQPQTRVRADSGRPPPSTGWWGSPSYDRPRIPKPNVPQPQTLQQQAIKIPETVEDYAELEKIIQQQTYQQPEPRFDEKRSIRYQEQSPFGPGVVPYRPVSTGQVTLSARKPVGSHTVSPVVHMPIMTFPIVRFKRVSFGRRE